MKTWPAMSPFSTSENVSRMQPSATLAAAQAAEALRATGADVVDFGAGEPDFDTPDNIKRAAEEAMRAGRTKYTATGGVRELQAAIIRFYHDSFGTEYAPTEVMATSGGKQAIFNAAVTLLNTGDEVLIPKPYWVTFPEVVVFAGATPVFIETETNNFLLTPEAFEQAITPRTKLVILNSPSNPSGRVLPPRPFVVLLRSPLNGISTWFPTSAICVLSTRPQQCSAPRVCRLTFVRDSASPVRSPKHTR